MANLFCYGSNNPTQLAERIGEDFQVMPAHLEGYQRVFRGFSRNWGGGTASIKKVRGGTVFGYVAIVSRDALARLDQFEGVPQGIYKRQKLTVEGPDGPVEAVAYVHTSTEFNKPSAAYLAAVARTVSGFWSNADGSAVTVADIPIR
jgi:gamma-glutamylcyclotransferase (GGCT)/AIG2-like uncharacterized protein YtfP